MKVLAAVALAVCVLVALATGIAIGAVSTADQPREWEDPDIGASIYEGVASEHHLWLVGSNGRLVRFDRETGERRIVAEEVQDILADGPRLWVLTLGLDRETFAVRDLNDPATPVRSGEMSGGYPQLIQLPDGVGVLTEDALFIPAADGLSRRALTPPQRGWTVATASASGSVYSGMNLGEFGGRLARIDPRDGVIHEIAETGADDEACAGEFDPSCDPVVGLLPDPDQPDCVIAASGQVHLGMTHGKVYRVCGDALTLIYETPNRTPLLARLLAPSDYWRDLTAPIESLTEVFGGWVAVSQGRYFRLRDGAVREHPMPDLRPWSGLFLSEEQDGVLFVMSGCCSGSVLDRQDWILAVPVAS